MRGLNISVIILACFVATQCFRSRIIIVEDAKACFRRALAGKRVTRSLVRRALPCERVEECQQECAAERRFFCEGFNYRLDPSGRGNGDCELLDLPVVRVDVRREVYPDPDFDVYERDRNSLPDCRGFRPTHRRYDGDRYEIDRRYDDRPISRPPPPPPPPPYRPRRPEYEYDRRGDGYYHHRSHYSGDYLPKPHYRPTPYLPTRPHEHLPRYKDKYYYERERDRHHWGLNRDWGSYGGSYGNFGKPASFYGDTRDFRNDNRRNYVPTRVGGSYDWGAYGGSYGTGGSSNNGFNWGLVKGIPSPYDTPAGDSYSNTFKKGYNYNKPAYGLDRFLPSGFLPSAIDTYRPTSIGGYTPHHGQTTSIGAHTPHHGQTDLQRYDNFDKYNFGNKNYGNYEPKPHYPSAYNPNQITENDFHSVSDDVVEHKKFPGRYNFLKDECSLRTATGFRLHKIIVKKFHSVPDIYECEMLCVKENEFECLSYAFRYTNTINLPTDNCYLSSRNYKELDFYTDLEPDRDFDIYTINNVKKCQETIPRINENSDCFWHIRSGQRLDDKVVRDSMSVKTIVDCQVECLKANKFLCRAFSFRFGPGILGGSIDNCQLTDWPFLELDPRAHLRVEPGFEIYERGSYGYGCEPNHFSIRGKDHPIIGANTDQLCYVGYGTPARLLPQGIRKSIYVDSELECKQECSKTRRETLFQCMSFSYRTKTQRGESNCDLSDILQRDLLENIDYLPDPDSWLFAWDNYNPECVALSDSNRRNRPSSRDDSYDLAIYGGHDISTALDTWHVYSVSGWPCRRGAGCRENRIGGFWFCELEGGGPDTWDYCCSPDHQCGYSEGFPYPWCYVGSEKSQWRKCNDHYYPYAFNIIDQHDKPYLPNYDPNQGHFIDYQASDRFVPVSGPSIHQVYRPNRPPLIDLPIQPPRKPTLDQYEQKFNMQFLDPPKPGGFGQPRHWPVSYLHREIPPGNGTNSNNKLERLKIGKSNDENGNKQNLVIKNLIKFIKTNDFDDLQYQIDNDTNKMKDILLVKIPLPTNFTKKSEKMRMLDSPLSQPIDLIDKTPETIKDIENVKEDKGDSEKSSSNLSIRRQVPVYTKSYIVRTNVTNYGRGL